MSDKRIYHPILAKHLREAGLCVDEAPSAEQWRQFLDGIDEKLGADDGGMLILDRNFDNMIRHAVDGFFIHDTRGNIIDANQAACQMLGYTHDELLSMGVADFEMDLEPGAIWDDMTVDEVYTVEGTHRRKDGETYPVETRVGAFMVDGRKVILALCRDITDRKQAEQKLRRLNNELEEARDEAIRANHSKSAFLANMSHELRTPLNAVIGYSEFLIEEMTDRDDQIYASDVERILTAGRHLLSLINDILDLSKIEAGKVELDITDISLSEMLADIESTAEPLARKNNNQLTIEFVGDVAEMRSDVTKIRQILFNLLSNACKFTSQGHVTLRVQPRSDTSLMEFSVTDTGTGMTEEQLDRIFNAFQQAEKSTTRKFGGTGLGLAITKHYCAMLKGSIHAESTIDEGTTFTVQLPVDLEQTLKTAGSDQKEAAAVTYT